MDKQIKQYGVNGWIVIEVKTDIFDSEIPGPGILEYLVQDAIGASELDLKTIETKFFSVEDMTR